MTEGERRDEIAGRLDKSLGVFDERMAREQVALQKQREEQSARSGGGGGSAGEGSEGGGGMGEGGDAGFGQGLPGEQDGEEGEASGSGQSTTASRGRSVRGNNLPPPPDVGDGSNDDVVARQLREAAEKEKDPELAKKLWDEYREYKKRWG